jgi:hypothetical protein
MRKYIIPTIFFLSTLSFFPLKGVQIKLDRSEIDIDFKDKGYFKSITRIELSNDLFFISDTMNNQIIEFKLQGNKLEFLRSIGRAGQGPGDLMRPSEISIKNGVLAVQDELGISFFGLDGSFQSKFQLLSDSIAFVLDNSRIYSATYDYKKPELIQVYQGTSAPKFAFQEKKKLFPLNYSIHKGVSPDFIERIIFEGILLRDSRYLYYLNKRFGKCLQYTFQGEKTAEKDLSPLLGKNEKAKVKENTRLFLEEGYDLIKEKRSIPRNFVFDAARIMDNRLYLLLESYDFIEKKKITQMKIVCIDPENWTVEATYVADIGDEWSFNFIVTKENGRPVFIVPLRTRGEDEKIYIFRPSPKSN